MNKRSQKSVNYRATSAADRAGNKRCGTCVMIRCRDLPKGRVQISCTDVESPIDPRKICDIYSRKRDTMAKLDAAKRNALPAKDFAGPDRSYPINDKKHARVALGRATQNASPEEASEIKAKVKRKFPSIAVGGGKGKKSDQPKFPKVAADYVS